MYTVTFGEKVYQKIYRYIDMYRAKYLELYHDTGLWYAEEIIKNQYIVNADMLTDVFVDGIYDIMHEREVLWYSTNPDMSRVTTISLGSRRLFITYLENSLNMKREVIDIEIYRK